MSSVVLILPAVLACHLLCLAVNYYAAGEFYKAARAKGWKDKKYFWLAFLVPLAGYLLIVALPDRSGLGISALVSDDLPEPETPVTALSRPFGKSTVSGCTVWIVPVAI